MHDREIAIRALLITGTCGSGKTTVAGLLTANFGWERIAEDDIWRGRFAKNRGAFGSEEHRQKRRKVHEVVFAAIHQAMRYGRRIVIDATVHESPPEAFLEYRDFFERYGVPWTFRVLHPRLEIAQDRDARRARGSLGPERVASLYAKFGGTVFDPGCFLDTSDDTPEQTVRRLLADLAIVRKGFSFGQKRERLAALLPAACARD